MACYGDNFTFTYRENDKVQMFVKYNDILALRHE
jgi:hypothetical protein